MQDKQPTLFYSWQSDNAKTSNYVENALKAALKNIASAITVEDAPRLDEDNIVLYA